MAQGVNQEWVCPTLSNHLSRSTRTHRIPINVWVWTTCVVLAFTFPMFVCSNPPISRSSTCLPVYFRVLVVSKFPSISFNTYYTILLVNVHAFVAKKDRHIYKRAVILQQDPRRKQSNAFTIWLLRGPLPRYGAIVIMVPGV